METEVLEVKILDIQEESFSINSEILSSLDQTDNTGIEFFISFKLNKNESVLVSEASLTYLIEKEETSEKLACISYSFVLYIKDLNNYIEDDKVRLPDRFMEELIYDVYIIPYVSKASRAFIPSCIFFRTIRSPRAFSKARVNTSSSISRGTTHTPSMSPTRISPSLIRTPSISIGTR